jgi:hypothetical protein
MDAIRRDARNKPQNTSLAVVQRRRPSGRMTGIIRLVGIPRQKHGLNYSRPRFFSLADFGEELHLVLAEDDNSAWVA